MVKWPFKVRHIIAQPKSIDSIKYLSLSLLKILPKRENTFIAQVKHHFLSIQSYFFSLISDDILVHSQYISTSENICILTIYASYKYN